MLAPKALPEHEHDLGADGGDEPDDRAKPLAKAGRRALVMTV